MRNLGEFAYDRRGAMAVLALVLSVAGALVGLPPRVDTTAAALLPEDEPHSLALTAMSEDLGGTGIITLVYDGDGDLGPVVDALSALDTVATAFAHLPEDATRHMALMRLDPVAVDEAADRIEGALRFGPGLNPMIAARILDAEGLTARLTPDGPPPGLLPDDDYERIVVIPTTSAFDAAFTERVVGDIRDTVAHTPVADTRLVYMGGTYVTIADAAASVRRDLARTSGLSAVLVLLVLVIGLRSVRTALLLFPPLLVAGVLNLAVLKLTVGALNTFTSLGSAVLIGLGIDFGVHLLARYREARATGAPERDSIAVAWASAGPPCTVAALTSAAGFSAAWVGDFRGLSELGLSLASGLLLSLVCMMLFLPALIAAFDRSEQPLLGAASARVDRSAPPRRPAAIGLGVFAAITVAIGLFAASTLTFEYDFTATGDVSRRFDALSADEQRLLVQAFPPVTFTLDDAAAADAFATDLLARRDSGELPHVAQVVWAGALLPADQDTRVAALSRVKAQLSDPAARHLPGALLHAMAPLHAWEPTVQRLQDIAPVLDDLLLSGRRVLVVPQGALQDMRQTAAMVDELDATGQTPASVHVLQGVIYRMVTRDAPRVVALAMGLVALLVLLDLRRVVPTALALFSLLAGLVWALGVVSALGVRISLGNLIGLPILLGIGVDVVVHLVHRLRHDTVHHAYRTVGIAAVLSTLTTIASFIALNLASSGAIRSLGQLVAVGLATLTPIAATALALAWMALRPGES